jgi:hypothetical protein
MTTKGDCCCCSACGVPLPKEVATCCLCVCDEICVTLEGTGVDCSCVIGKSVVSWNPEECAYIGAVGCGDVYVDVRIDIRKCEGNCHLCLTSICLGLDGACPDTCVQFAPGNLHGDCGKYLRECSQRGGFNADWSVDVSECGDADCSTVTLNAECSSRVNPAGSGVTRLCKDCDCVCDCVSIGYEDAVFYPDAINVCWEPLEEGNGWRATFTDCGDNIVTLTVRIVRSEDGCCYWRLETSKGTVIGDNERKTYCPDVSLTWDILLEDESTAMVSVVCNSCYVASTCLECVDDMPSTLTATFQTTGVEEEADCSCLDGATITLTKYVQCESSPECSSMDAEILSDELPRWSGSATICDTTICLCLTPCEGEGCEEDEVPLTLHIQLGGCDSTFETSTECAPPSACIPLELGFSTAVPTELCAAIEGNVSVTIE